ncbi:MAG: hypothetical protein D8M59_14490 [Planctomycetes bacterium]|nr:hypothetical protein [Planctomycetota bacterium]NOG53318.1 hypothetical protein [Planctomycetota bacterium]
MDPILKAIIQIPEERARARQIAAEQAKQRAEERRRWEGQERLREERKRRAAEEAAKADHLRSCVQKWQEARQFREYARALQTAACRDGAVLVPHSRVAVDIEWILQHADQIDPLVANSTYPANQ